MKAHVKRGDEVMMIAGNAKGKRACVLQIITRTQRVLLEAAEEDSEGRRWINPVKKHQKGTQDNPSGGIIEQEAPIHISNVMKIERYKKRKKRKDPKSSSI